MVLDFLAVDNFDFTRKIVKKNLDEKLVKMLGVVKIEFLDFYSINLALLSLARSAGLAQLVFTLSKKVSFLLSGFLVPQLYIFLLIFIFTFWSNK